MADCSAMKVASRQIVASTGKSGDGIVSRYVNRPISRAITRVLLRFPGIRPHHATAAAGAIGILMAASLLVGGKAGLLLGAILFQLASIVDGVDGEIARATFRSSSAGAMWDSLTDAATNISFIGGVTVNLWLRGFEDAAAADGIAASRDRHAPAWLAREVRRWNVRFRRGED
jgi:CDP-L-myo-inositol myo-inositolphosphotransferase